MGYVSLQEGTFLEKRIPSSSNLPSKKRGESCLLPREVVVVLVQLVIPVSLTGWQRTDHPKSPYSSRKLLDTHVPSVNYAYMHVSYIIYIYLCARV